MESQDEHETANSNSPLSAPLETINAADLLDEREHVSVRPPEVFGTESDGDNDADDQQKQFDDISKQLSILNGKGSMNTKTSQGKKRLQKAPLPRKLMKPRVNEQEENWEGNEGEEKPDDNDSDWIDIESEVESNDNSGNELHIIEEPVENEMDKELQSKAEILNLSAVNVKSILKQIITNDHVVRMVRNTIENEKDIPEAVYVPKMTRSKFKQVLEKEGNVPHPWPISPLKRKRAESPSFMDMEFSDDEDEEDEEYDPENEPIGEESDEDTDSVMSSSCVSDVGSPMPTTPSTASNTPAFVRTGMTPVLSATEDSQDFISPMGPPIHLPPASSKKLSLGQKFKDAMEDEEKKRVEEELIPSRTRSKYPIDKSLLELEANFVAPDITPDMYETDCDDHDWQGFLTSLVKQDDIVEETPPEAGEEKVEEEDPEYNYLAEIEAEPEYDQDDFRFDKAVMVSKKELNSLMDELLESYEEMEDLDDTNKMMIRTQARNSLLMSQNKFVKDPERISTYHMNPEERAIFDDQLRKHVQLLTQSFLMAQGNKAELQIVCDASRIFINEMHQFAMNSELLTKKTSAYRACSLEDAVIMVNNTDLWTEDKPADLAKDYAKNFKLKMAALRFGADDFQSEPPLEFPFHCGTMQLPPLSPKQMDAIWNSPVFLYPEFLPRGNFFRQCEIKRDRSRIKFLESEDMLLAIGLGQFKHLKACLEYIQKFLLPVKTQKQIYVRIKNLRTSNAKDNPVKYFKKNKEVPQIHYDVKPFDLSMKQAPKDQKIDPSILPSWCQIFYQSPETSTDPMKRRRCNSMFLPDCPLSDNKQKSHSAPATPHNSDATCRLSDLTKQLPPKIRKKSMKRKLKYSPRKVPRGGFVPFNPTGVTGEGQRISPVTVCFVDKISTPNSTFPQQPSPAVTWPTSTPGTIVATAGPSGTPTIILINTSAPMHTPTIVSGTTLISVPVTETKGQPVVASDSLPKMEPSCPSPLPTDLDLETNIPCPNTPASDVISNPSSTNSTPVSKSALEIVASYAPYFVSKSAGSPSSTCNPHQKFLETTPTKKGNTQYRTVAPRPVTTPPDSAHVVSPFLKKPKSSPRRRQLQQHARAILPKGFSLNTYVSPTKKLASSLMSKALYKGMKGKKRQFKLSLSPCKGRSNCRILPNTVAPAAPGPLTLVPDHREQDDDGVGSKNDTASEHDTLESDDTMDTEECEFTGREHTLTQKPADTESDETQSDSQEDEDYLANLMMASSTVRYDPRKPQSRLKVNRAKRHREQTLAMLSADLLESDPYLDERDTAFAQAYLQKVKKALQDDMDKYEKFLRLLYEFGKSDDLPITLYDDLSDLLKDQADLLYDFSAFLLPEQAMECGCFQANLEFNRARTFLRKLEVNFSKTPSHFQKIMKMFTKWWKKPGKVSEELRVMVEPLLKGQHHLLEEFSVFFPDERPPDCYMEDFEEVRLDGSGDDEGEVDEVEEVILPDEEEIQGSKRCQCTCHTDTTDDTYRKRIKHCYSCCLTVIDRELAYRINKQTIKKVKVTFHPPVKASESEETGTEKEVNDEMENQQQTKEGPSTNFLDTEGAEKENIEFYDVEHSAASESPQGKSVTSKLKSPHKKTIHKRYPWRSSKFTSRLGGSLYWKKPVKSSCTSTFHQDSSVQPESTSRSTQGQVQQLSPTVPCTVQAESLPCTQVTTVSTISTATSTNQATTSVNTTNQNLLCIDSNSSSDILAKAFKAAMMGEGSMDSSSFSMNTGPVTHSLPSYQGSTSTGSEMTDKTPQLERILPKQPFSSSFSAFTTAKPNVSTALASQGPLLNNTAPNTTSCAVHAFQPFAIVSIPDVTQTNSVQIQNFSPTFTQPQGENTEMVDKEVGNINLTSPKPTARSSTLVISSASTGKPRRIAPTPVTDNDISSSLPSPFEKVAIHSPQTSFTGTIQPMGNKDQQITSSNDTDTTVTGVTTGQTGVVPSSMSMCSRQTTTPPVSEAGNSRTNSEKHDDSSGSSSTKSTGKPSTVVVVQTPSMFSEDAHEGFMDKFPSNQLEKSKDFDLKTEESLFTMFKRAAESESQSDISSKDQIGQHRSVVKSKVSESQSLETVGSEGSTQMSADSELRSGESGTLYKSDLAGQGGNSKQSSRDHVQTAVFQVDTAPEERHSGEKCMEDVSTRTGQKRFCDSISYSNPSDQGLISVGPGHSHSVLAQNQSCSEDIPVKSTSSSVADMSLKNVIPALQTSCVVSDETQTKPTTTTTPSSSETETSSDSCHSVVEVVKPFSGKLPQAVFSETVYTKTKYKTTLTSLNTEDSKDFFDHCGHSRSSETVYSSSSATNVSSVLDSRSDVALLPDSSDLPENSRMTSSVHNVSSAIRTNRLLSEIEEESTETENMDTEPPLSSVHRQTSQADNNAEENDQLSVSQSTIDSMEMGSSSETTEEEVSWSRETDKIILEICKQLGTTAAAFEKISQNLVDRTPSQVKRRLNSLVQLMAESGSDEEL